jgi:hypothetical protein
MAAPVVGAIESDVTAWGHLVREPREPWHRNADTERGERTYLVRPGTLPPVPADVLRVGRVGMVGVVALFSREWLWEVTAPGVYLLRCFALGTDGHKELGIPVRGVTPADVVSAARPVDHGGKTTLQTNEYSSHWRSKRS